MDRHYQIEILKLRAIGEETLKHHGSDLDIVEVQARQITKPIKY